MRAHDLPRASATVKRRSEECMPGTPYVFPAEGALTAFTDGASLPAPRRGGIGIHFVHSDSVGQETGFDLAEPGYAGATNNQMELQAVITALKAILSGR